MADTKMITASSTATGMQVSSTDRRKKGRSNSEEQGDHQVHGIPQTEQQRYPSG